MRRKSNLRKKKLAKNTVASLIAQASILICGFVLPRFFLQYFGSEVNGLVNSITQFLSIISFLELGVGAVVQSSLYKPLAEHDEKQISCIMVSANKFFRNLAKILLLYVIGLIFFYPLLVRSSFGHIYTAVLIAAISISSFAQYYFGIVNALLLNADQCGYIQYNAQTAMVILNTAACVFLMHMGASIQIVKLTTSLIYLIRPLALKIYVQRHYSINWEIEYREEPIQQKWNGIAQHVAAVVLDGTDTIVLTIFSTLANVSVYSVYFLVVRGVKTMFMSLTGGIQSLLGELWAKQELEKLRSFFEWIEWSIHTGVTYTFGCTAVLLVPFVSVYTMGINDVNYIQPFFAFLLTMANAMHCLRLPYNLMVLAAGHYKQTQRNYIVAVILNIAISILAVKHFGLIGVAIGTVIAMGYQTIWLAIYDSKHFINWPIWKVAKQFFVDFITTLLLLLVVAQVDMEVSNYLEWSVLAVKVALFAGTLAVIVNMLFYRQKMVFLLGKLCRKIKCINGKA